MSTPRRWVPRGVDPELALGRFAFWVGVIALSGVVLSGPVAMGLVAWLGPQPEWAGAVEFVRHYHPVQVAPYLFGFALVAGSVGMVIALARAAPARLAVRGTLAVVTVAVYAVLVTLNYVIQSAFLPALVAQPGAGSLVAIEGLVMANPSSLAWALEMWGYAFLGIALWIVAPCLSGTRLERIAANLLVFNGMVSVVGALVTVVALDWVFTPLGTASVYGWNALFAAAVIAYIEAWRRRVEALRRVRARGPVVPLARAA